MALRSGIVGAGLLLALGAAAPPALAGGVDTLSCGGSWSFFSCVRRLNDRPAEPVAPDPREQAEAAERERRWLARCRPALRQDRYGVGRYVYAAPGCEYGRTED
jgi:hypothetical protein